MMANGPVIAAEFLEGTERMKALAYSPAVITQGGRIVWLAGVGGTLSDIVTMTVFIRNQADGDAFVKIRTEVFKSGFPASALVTSSKSNP